MDSIIAVVAVTCIVIIFLSVISFLLALIMDHDLITKISLIFLVTSFLIFSGLSMHHKISNDFNLSQKCIDKGFAGGDRIKSATIGTGRYGVETNFCYDKNDIYKEEIK